SMGAAGTAPPTGWRHFTSNFGNNATWAASIPPSGANSVATMAVGTAGTTLTASTTPPPHNNNPHNPPPPPRPPPHPPPPRAPPPPPPAHSSNSSSPTRPAPTSSPAPS